MVLGELGCHKLLWSRGRCLQYSPRQPARRYFLYVCRAQLLWVVMMFVAAVLVLSLLRVGHSLNALPPYVHQCSLSDPQVQKCFADAIMHIRPWLARGIPEIAVPSTEPFRLDELSLALTVGPKGYRINLRDLDVNGITDYVVWNFSVDAQSGRYALDVTIPELRIVADYSSSGTLIIIPASGSGEFHGILGGVRAVLHGLAERRSGPETDHFHVTRLNADLKVKDVNMKIERSPNPIVARVTNLVLRTSGRQVLDAMMPELRVKLGAVFQTTANEILDKIPASYIVRP